LIELIGIGFIAAACALAERQAAGGARFTSGMQCFAVTTIVANCGQFHFAQWMRENKPVFAATRRALSPFICAGCAAIPVAARWHASASCGHWHLPARR